MNTQMLLPLSLMSSMALPMMAQNVNTENQKPDVLFLFYFLSYPSFLSFLSLIFLFFLLLLILFLSKHPVYQLLPVGEVFLIH